MFGMGGTEILVILIVALLFLGPDKLPEAAKSISKGIRDLRKQTRDFQESIEADEKIGGAIRDIKSALNGEEPRRARPPRPLPGATTPEAAAAATAAITAGVPGEAPAAGEGAPTGADEATGDATPGVATSVGAASFGGEVAPSFVREAPGVTLPATAGESGAEGGTPSPEDVAAESQELAALIKPAEGAIAKGTSNGHG